MAELVFWTDHSGCYVKSWRRARLGQGTSQKEMTGLDCNEAMERKSNAKEIFKARVSFLVIVE